MARFWPGRIAVTGHITGPPARECGTRARGRRKGHADLDVASGGLLGWSTAVTGGSPGRFMDGRPWVRSVRDCMPASGEWSGRAVRCASRDSFIGASAPSADLCSRRLRQRPSLTWLLPSVIEPDPGDGGQPCLPVTGSCSSLQVFIPATGSSLQVFIVAGQAVTESPRQGDACLLA
jgi:hypothetical protein